MIFYHQKQEKRHHESFIPDIGTFLSNAQQYHFGGTCFTLNAHFYHLLCRLGFKSSLVLLGHDHMGVLVELPEFEGEKVYVDVGAAAPRFHPVRKAIRILSEFGIDIFAEAIS